MKIKSIALKITALCMACLITMVAFGCTGTPTDEDPQSSSTSTSEQENGNNVTSNTGDSTGDTTGDSNGDSNGDITGTTIGTTASQTQTPSDKLDIESLKGTTVKVLMWRNLAINEAQKIKDFEKKYGITVKVEYSTMAAYISKLASLVTNNDSPDVAVMFDGGSTLQGMFPAGTLALFQPIEAAKQNLNDGFWNLPVMDKYKINGKHYTFIADSNWYSCTAIVLYNKDLFNSLNITTPRELFNQGNWNWDTLKSTALQVLNAGRASGNNYIGALGGNAKMYYMLSAGTDFVTYNGSKFSSNITSPAVINAWTALAEMRESDALSYDTNVGTFFGGNVSMLFTNIWATLLNGGLGNLNFNADYVPFPSPKGSKEIMVAGFNYFAIPKGAENPQAAGLFIRYFLDSANNPPYKGLTNCPDSEDMFKYVTSAKRTFHVPYSNGVIGYTNVAGLINLTDTLWNTAPQQITTVLQQNKSWVDNAVSNINRRLD